MRGREEVREEVVLEVVYTFDHSIRLRRGRIRFRVRDSDFREG
jgi:hypothetical protein